MRMRVVMESNRDTAGWGLIGTVIAFATSSYVLEQLMTASLVAGAGWLGSYFTKKVYLYLGHLVTRWWKNRKTKSNNQ